MKTIRVSKRIMHAAPKIAAYVTTVTIGSTMVISSSASALSLHWLDPRTYLASSQTSRSTQTVQNAQNAANQAKVKLIISKGDQEINRRLTSLNTLTKTITAATKLSASDRTTLTDEVNSTVSGLTTLKAKLDADTTVDAAKTDAQSILTGYRVYALVTPKVHLVKTADDIQVANGKLTTLIAKLQTQITAKQQAGKDVTALQTKLTDMTNKTNMSQSIAANIETNVIKLQPTDYNSNHTILSGDAAQLKTARSDSNAALADAKSIVTSLKTL